MQDLDSPGPLGGAAAHVPQAVAANLQLLAMLEVMEGWMRADAADLAEAAEQTESLAAALLRSPPSMPPDDARERTCRMLAAIHDKLDRIVQLAPLQARDAATSQAVLEGLRRLRVANDMLRAALDAGVT